MKRTRWMALGLCLVGGLATLALVAEAFVEPAAPPDRKALEKLMNDGNWNDAFQGYKKLALDPQADKVQVGNDLAHALSCLQQLGRTEEIDDFREEVIKLHAGNWRLLKAAADTFQQHDHQGFMIAGRFVRGGHRGGGKMVHAFEHDRVRALQLLNQALPLAVQDEEKAAVASFFQTFADALVGNRSYNEAWRLQYLTDLAVLPDYEEGWYGWGGGQTRGAPVDAAGNPVYHQIPQSWEAAASDGERWRWCLTQVVEYAPNRLNQVRWDWANFLQNQFGVQTMAQWGWFGRMSDDEEGAETGTYALHTLDENETIARLATGIKRFKLPDEFNHIRVYQQIADEPQTGQGDVALEQLAQIFENRRQYPKAADYWRRVIKQYGPGHENYRQQRLDQIVKNWGRFEMQSVQPAGEGAKLSFRFRNGKQVKFEARAVHVDQILADVKTYLKTRPKNLDWQQLQIDQLGWRLVQEGQDKYLGPKVAEWSLDLDPLEKHFDRRIDVATPLQKAGGYWISAQMADGNRSEILLWVSDTTILKKPAAEKTFVFVGDSVTGKPIAKANVEFFGYRQRWDNNQPVIDVKNFSEFTDADGQLFVGGDAKREDDQYAWLVIARTAEGRFAHLGFSGIWRNGRYDEEYNATKVFAISDRPVYRPKQNVKFKFWVRHARYDQENVSDFAGQMFNVVIQNPKGEKVFEQSLKADDYAGLDGSFDLPADATLGTYQFFLQNHGGGSFRVEEYKKPEYEVTVSAPTEPVQLGEKITAKIEAKYLFGAPVTRAKVKYKIERTSHTEQWYPYGRWDWFYGRGYWWYAYNYLWYPGFENWGCMRPLPFWWGGGRVPPELVAEVEAPIGEDGTLSVEIDTLPAKEIHGNQDHSYRITAEVVDASRRTIVGSGNVIAARRPFQVFAWVDRGYYNTGDTVDAEFSAHTLDHRPVKGKGKLRLLSIRYDEKRQPIEEEVQAWDLDTDEQGQAAQKFVAAQPGQFRLSYTVTDAAGHAIEGGYVFVVRGRGAKSADFRFNEIELIPEKREYAPGETVNLQVNINRTGGTVLLFVRPTNGVYLPPKVLRYRGKTAVVPIEVVKKDMPNFFVEAVTIADGRLHTETKEIVVPPEQRILNVALEPNAATYKPGQEAEVKLRLTGPDNKPFVGSTVMSIYDKAVEYISGGSNVPEIKEHFWKWRRSHHPHNEHNLAWYTQNMVRPMAISMGDLGVFGGEMLESDREELADGGARWDTKARGRNFGFGGGMGGMLQSRASGLALPSAPGAEPAMAAMEMAGAPMDALALGDAGGGPAAAPAAVQPTIRQNFADTALWAGALTTDGDGVATVKLTLPESLTTWKVRAWGMGHGTKVGQAETEVITRKNLLVRLQAPRFFTQKDEVVLSANVHNYLDHAKTVQVVLELDGPCLKPLGENAQQVEIAAGGEARVDWRVAVVESGEAVVRMKALTDEESDAVQMSFPAQVHGMLKLESFSGVVRPDKPSDQVVLRVPAQRRINDSRLEVRYSPTLAGAMVDALPYLVDYPYGCTEQTLNRFLPTVITQKILLNMQLDLKAIQEKRTNLNAQELGDDVQRAQGWKRFDRNPVFDQQEVQAMVKEGVERLTSMQNGDGGWGWFSGWGEHSWPHTTAVVVHGLQIAQQNDVALVPNTLERGVEWLRNYQAQQVQMLQNAAAKKNPWKAHADNLDVLVFMVLTDADQRNADMLNFLERDRAGLAVYSKAMYGLALHKLGEQEKLAATLKNIEQFLVQDDENQTAYLRLPEDNYWWHWYGSEIEAMSYYLKLLSRTDPQGETASRLVKYLLNNRKHATYWNSTRDTAVAIEALAEYLKASGEQRPEMTVEIWLNGQKQKEVQITAENLFSFDNKFVLFGDAVPDGEHTIELRKQGGGRLYWNAYLTTFTLEDHIEKAGLEVKVDRHVYRLKRVDKQIKVAGSRGQAVDQKVEKYEREELANLAQLKSGDLVEVELVIDSKNDYEYLIFEDMKAAGFEAVELRSGYGGNEMGAYVEYRDNRVSFFVRALARGRHSVSYRLRAEIPGKFSALPTKGYAMYAPELQGNSDEIKLQIED